MDDTHSGPPPRGLFQRLRLVKPLHYAVFILAIVTTALYINAWLSSPAQNYGINAQEKIASIVAGGPAEGAGLLVGDSVVSSDYHWNYSHVGDTITVRANRNGDTIVVRFALTSLWAERSFFYSFYYGLIVLISVLAFLVLLVRPEDRSTGIFFVLAQALVISSNTAFPLGRPEWTVPSSVFVLTYPFLGPVLFDFLLKFPAAWSNSLWVKRTRSLGYFLALTFGMFLWIACLLLDRGQISRELFEFARSCANRWMGVSLAGSLIFCAYRYWTTIDRVGRNQMRWVLLGSIIGLLTPTSYGLLQTFFDRLEPDFPRVLQYINGVGVLCMVICFAIAILRHKMWGIEVIIKRSLLYGGVTIAIAGLYFVLVLVAEDFIGAEAMTGRVLALVFSALAFIPVREGLQRRIDHMFHQEPYDVSEAGLQFEYQLTGIYDAEALHQKIAEHVDAILHFDAFSLFLKTGDTEYHSVAVLGKGGTSIVVPTDIMKSLLGTDMPFDPDSLTHAERGPVNIRNLALIVPLHYHRAPIGFFACGGKKSERPYSQQDVQLLRLLAQRSAALLTTAELYRNELDRQLMLERERMRISKDMHDDVGSNLTKIAVMSELALKQGVQGRTADQLEKISQTARDVVDNISEIVWALNPKNDKLENFISYTREHATEFFEGTNIRCVFDFPHEQADLSLSAEVRRNLFLVIKEALNNAAKHSGATGVSLSMISATNGLTWIIHDNGKGFDSGALHNSGNGLTNMQKRMEDVGGSLEIQSAPGKGTTMTIKVTTTTKKA